LGIGAKWERQLLITYIHNTQHDRRQQRDLTQTHTHMSP
jgi:hypothetical protein